MVRTDDANEAYRQIVMMLGGAVIVAVIGLAGWLLRADHDYIRDSSARALQIALEGEKTDIVFRAQMAALNSDVASLRRQVTELTATIEANQQQIKANQVKILALLNGRRPLD